MSDGTSGVDSDTFVETNSAGGLKSVDFKGLASAIFSSYFLTAIGGLIAVLVAIVKAPLDLLGDFFGWLSETLGLGFSVPENSLETAWTNAAEIFPLTGALDWAIGVVLVIAFFVMVRWMFEQVMEGL